MPAWNGDTSSTPVVEIVTQYTLPTKKQKHGVAPRWYSRTLVITTSESCVQTANCSPSTSCNVRIPYIAGSAWTAGGTHSCCKDRISHR